MTTGDFIELLKAWGAGIFVIVAVFFVGVFLYSIYWWCTSEDFRAALMTNNPSGKRLPEHIVKAKLEQRKHKIATSTPTQLRQIIIEEAPNLVGAANRIPVGYKDELEELRALVSVIGNKKVDTSASGPKIE